MFGKKIKTARVKEPEVESEEEVAEVEVPGVRATIDYRKLDKQSQTPKPIPVQTKTTKELVEAPAVPEKNTAMIISAEIVDGMRIKTIILSNQSIGEVGDTFEM